MSNLQKKSRKNHVKIEPKYRFDPNQVHSPSFHPHNFPKKQKNIGFGTIIFWSKCLRPPYWHVLVWELLWACHLSNTISGVGNFRKFILHIYWLFKFTFTTNFGFFTVLSKCHNLNFVLGYKRLAWHLCSRLFCTTVDSLGIYHLYQNLFFLL